VHVEDIDELLSAQARLALMASLFEGRALGFSELKAATGLADGNLHVQTNKLAEAGYLSITKFPRGHGTRTAYRITENGQIRFRLYVQRLLEVMGDGEGVIRPTEARERHDDHKVW